MSSVTVMRERPRMRLYLGDVENGFALEPGPLPSIAGLILDSQAFCSPAVDVDRTSVDVLTKGHPRRLDLGPVGQHPPHQGWNGLEVRALVGR
jgi:hypothetical protein